MILKTVIVLDDMSNKLKNDLADYYSEGRHDDIQMIVMCQKPALIFNTARMSCDTIYITTYNGADLFKKFKEAYNCKHDFHGIVSELNIRYYNCTNGMADELRYSMIKYIKRTDFFFIYRSRTMIYDWIILIMTELVS